MRRPQTRRDRRRRLYRPLVLNVWSGKGATQVWIDDLEVSPVEDSSGRRSDHRKRGPRQADREPPAGRGAVGRQATSRRRQAVLPAHDSQHRHAAQDACTTPASTSSPLTRRRRPAFWRRPPLSASLSCRRGAAARATVNGDRKAFSPAIKYSPVKSRDSRSRVSFVLGFRRRPHL